MKVTIAHDYLTQRGGAERVALHLAQSFDAAPFYTSVYEATRTYREFARLQPRTSWLQLFSAVRREPRLALALLPGVWQDLRAEGSDVVIASSSGWAHGIRTEPGCRKIVYCHNTARWVYQPEHYAKDPWARRALGALHPMLSAWDKAAAATADRYLVNSTVVAQRVRDAYGIEPEVLHPPVSIDAAGEQHAIPGIEPGYWLTIARRRGYKNTQAVIDGTKGLPGSRLVVAGVTGPTRHEDHVTSVGVVTDPQLRWLYANARALVTVSYEDFGLTPLEANAFGTPVAVLRAGGFLDSTVEGVSGQFVEAPTAAAVRDCLVDFPEFDAVKLVAHAERFSTREFDLRLNDVIKEVTSS